MLRNYLISIMEKRLGVSLEYMRYISKHSRRLFFKFLKIMSFSQVQKAATKEMLAVTGLTATLHEDCGECVQISVNMAKSQGVSLDIIRALIHGKPEQLPGSLRLVHDYVQTLNSGTGDERLRTALLSEIGDEALIEIAMTAAASRVYPQVKRALGFAVSCSLQPAQI